MTRVNRNGQGLSHLVSDAIDRAARALASSTDIPDAGRRIVSAGRLRAGIAAGTVAVAGTVAALTWSTGGEHRDDAVPSPSPTAGQTAMVTIPIDQAREYSPWGTWSVDWCGSRAPDPETTGSGFTLKAQWSQVAEPTQTVSMQSDVTYEGTPVDVGFDSTYLLVRDDVVVGAFSGYSNSATYSFKDGGTLPADGQMVDIMNLYLGSACAWFSDDPSEVLLAAGDYQLISVVHLHHTRAEAALRQLYESGHSLAPASGTWNPGSIDCRNAILYSQESPPYPVPVECEPFGVNDVTIDRAAGTVTLPYEVAAGPDNLDVTLVSAPYTLTIAQDLTKADLGDSFGGSWTPNPPACGEVNFASAGVELSLTAADPGGDATLSVTDMGAVNINVDTGPDPEVQVATVKVPARAHAWLVDENSTGAIVGEATVTFDPTTVAVDRSKDYGHTTMHLTDVTYCPKPSGGAQDYILDNPANVTDLLIEGAFSVKGSDGSTRTGTSAWVQTGRP